MDINQVRFGNFSTGNSYAKQAREEKPEENRAEEIKKTPPKTIVKKTASTVGNFFVKGFSYGVSFVDGVKENKEDNRLKSGVKQVYDDSFLSLVEYGEEIEIKEGQEFYFVVKKVKNKD